VSKKRRGLKGQAPTRRQGGSSYAIPIIVGAVVLAIIVGAILSAKNRQAAATGSPAEALGQTGTPQAPSILPIPYPDVARMPLQEVQAKLEEGTAILVDVRSKQSYDAGHAAGALSIPEAEMATRLSELPRDKEIILYCT
jgi:3-mercaptopyruvate sulfurtransferase SseA